MYNPWEENVKEVEEEFGDFVNWEEDFYVYICPECREPIFKCDWSKGKFTDLVCPICKWRGD